MYDEGDIEEVPTVQVDSLGLNSLSIDDKSKDEPPTGNAICLHVPCRF
jgi:hypothetical protein